MPTTNLKAKSIPLTNRQMLQLVHLISTRKLHHYLPAHLTCHNPILRKAELELLNWRVWTKKNQRIIKLVIGEQTNLIVAAVKMNLMRTHLLKMMLLKMSLKRSLHLRRRLVRRRTNQVL